jgi:hypothetical protein
MEKSYLRTNRQTDGQGESSIPPPPHTSFLEIQLEWLSLLRKRHSMGYLYRIRLKPDLKSAPLLTMSRLILQSAPLLTMSRLIKTRSSIRSPIDHIAFD